MLFNFRADRMVQISKAFEYEDFDAFDRVRFPKVCGWGRPAAAATIRQHPGTLGMTASEVLKSELDNYEAMSAPDVLGGPWCDLLSVTNTWAFPIKGSCEHSSSRRNFLGCRLCRA